ncbi:conserved Plasmodium protein, unknown function [Plasmodium relictum]|uniref:Uncharacterized protein n=1 Tax=Plasmodium relictum TaxID=85471 RepID=A0A1J1H2N0_PLARL|nr:conserved Plasmodium protein, unknown function [Plasmodium relictum]CRG99185.1 conserved Plasmodium protein, unknown function [Plasmodium relictum]
MILKNVESLRKNNFMLNHKYFEKFKFSTKILENNIRKNKSFEEKWKYIIRNDYINKITHIFENNNKNDMTKKNNCCHFIIGAEGLGKKFFIEKSRENFLNNKNEKKKKYIFFEYDFKLINDISFNLKLHSLESSLRYKLLKEVNNDIENKKIQLKDLYHYLVDKEDHVLLSKMNSFFKYIINNPQMFDYLNDQDREKIQNFSILLEKGKFFFEDWNSFVKILLRKLNVKCFCSYLNEFSASLYFFKMIAEYEEHDYYLNNSRNIMTNYSNGLYIYKYFLSILKFLEMRHSYNFYFIFINFHLSLLCSQPVRSFNFFINFLNENIQKMYNIPVIIHSIKNLEIMKFIFIYNSIIMNLFLEKKGKINNNNFYYMNNDMNINENESSSFSKTTSNISLHKMDDFIKKKIEYTRKCEQKIQDKNKNKEKINYNYYNYLNKDELENYELIKSNLVEINDFSYDMIKCIMVPNFTKNEEISKCIYNIIGGNINLIKMICKGLYKLNEEYNESKIINEIENEKKKNITYDIDEEALDHKNSIEEIVQYKKLEKEKLFLKNISQNVLHTFILDFEHKIINFFSLPNIEDMKLDNIKEKRKGLTCVEFYFTIFEVIRYFLKKQKVFCKNIINLNNPILLGLIDVNIIHYNYENKYLELTNKFYEVLLLNYIDLKYKQFPMKFKAKYNINYVLNYKVIEQEYKLLESQA